MKKITKWMRILPACMLAFSISAQVAENLVENGDFSNISGKLRRTGYISMAEGWSSPTGISADLFSAQGKMPDIMVPENIYGKEDAHAGDSYAGIVAYSYNDKEKRQYITTKLKTPMKKGMRYKVYFYASLSELSKYSSNRLGAHFSKKDYSTSEKVPAMILDTHIEHPNQEIFTGMYGWDLVCGEYVAKGGEKYITIGNFYPNDQVGNERNKKPREIKGTQMVAAYYYIDDVNVELLDEYAECDCPYGDEAEKVSATLYQRTPSINDKMTAKQKVEAHDIYYLSGRYDITMAGDNALNTIAEIMKENAGLTVKIIGHTDANEAGNAELQGVSLKRAEFIRSQMVGKGIDASRFTIVDAKNTISSPYTDANDEENVALAKNRRVTFEVE